MILRQIFFYLFILFTVTIIIQTFVFIHSVLYSLNLLFSAQTYIIIKSSQCACETYRKSNMKHLCQPSLSASSLLQPPPPPPPQHQWKEHSGEESNTFTYIKSNHMDVTQTHFSRIQGSGLNLGEFI